MTNQQQADQRRLEEILKLARMQLNEEYMKRHSIAHTSWLTSARTAWNTSGILLPFSTKFVYPSEEEVVARGVEIYNTLSPRAVPVPATDAIVKRPVLVEEVKVKPTTEILQAGGDFVLAEVVEEPPMEPVVEAAVVVVPEETPAVKEISVNDTLLENRFKSLFTKWGGRGNF